MPPAGRPALRRSSRSARACGAASAALLKGSGAVWPCGTITGASTCPMPSSRSLPFWASQARPPSCGRLREMAAPSASSARSRRTCSGGVPSTPSRSLGRRCSTFGRATTPPGSSNGTGSRHPRPCDRTSFQPRHGPRSINPVSHRPGALQGARVPLDLVPYPSAEALNHSATAGAWDVTFMTVDHQRETLVDFGPAYAVFEATYLVPSASPIRSITDVDQPGIRVSAIRQGGLALRLSQSLRNARLVPAPTLEAAYEMMHGRKVDAIASQRGRLNALASRHPGTRVLDGSFATGRQAIAVPKHRPTALRFVCRLMEKAKASGEVRRALDAARIKDETVAPPELC